jgi:hypothetical protein
MRVRKGVDEHAEARSMPTEHADGACRRSTPTEHAEGARRRSTRGHTAVRSPSDVRRRPTWAAERSLNTAAYPTGPVRPPYQWCTMLQSATHSCNNLHSVEHIQNYQTGTQQVLNRYSTGTQQVLNRSPMVRDTPKTPQRQALPWQHETRAARVATAAPSACGPPVRTSSHARCGAAQRWLARGCLSVEGCDRL